MVFGQTSTAPSAGDGTSGNPYQIASLENLYWVAENSSRWGYYYIQTANIDATPTEGWFSDGSGGFYGWVPIGNSTTPFTATYNGNGNSIDGLYINRTVGDYQGLFGNASGATISNLGVRNVDINGRYYIGGLAGQSSSTNINNCYSTGSVTGIERIGSLVGFNTNSSTVSNSYSTGSVAGIKAIGGLVGANYNLSTLSSSYSTCNITSNDRSGGLLGLNYTSTVINCYSKGNVSGDSYVGGLLGSNYSACTVSNSYSTGSVSANSVVGGLIGYNLNSAVNNSFWNTETSGRNISAGGTGKTTAEMKTQSTFTAAGWDFATIWKMRSYKNDGYPYLRWQYPSPEAIAPSAGDGTSGSPYQISILENLYWVAENSSRWGYYYIQTANIDATETSGWSSEGWIPIGNGTIQFTGNYNGDGHTIDGLYINRSGIEYQGLFGKTNAATITNLGVTNVNITGFYRAGGLVGCNYNNSTVTKCYGTGNVSGNSMIGCLVGQNLTASVSKCYTTGSVSGVRMLGGLVGLNEAAASVSNSYSRCSVTASMYEVGGLVGFIYNGSTVSNSYSTGSVVSPSFDVGGLVGRNYSCPAVSNGFWDTETSGRTSSAGGTGKTTVLMKTNTTFTNAGWDYTNVWEMIGTNYPRLKDIPETALPVELTSFTANVINNKFRLNWQTETEVNNYGFEIEKHEKANVKSEEWEKVGFVNGHGNSNSPKTYSFTDKDILSGTYFYRLKQIDTDGKFEYSKEVEVTINNVPTKFELKQNYPNPFNPVTSIQYAVDSKQYVTLKVYDILGRDVATLVNEVKEAGKYELNFDAKQLPSGIYFYKLQAGPSTGSGQVYSQTKKMTLLR